MGFQIQMGFQMGFYMYFLTTYSVCSVSCFLLEIIAPSMRVKEITRHEIVQNYKIMTPTVVANLALAYPYYSAIEKYLTFDNIIVLNCNDDFSDGYYDGYSDVYCCSLWYLYFFYYFFIWLLLTDVSFFAVHYMLHTPQMYWLHAKHHSFRYTHGIGAIYSSVFEFVVGNLGTATLPIYVFSIPQDYVKIIIVLASFYTVVISHSGFKCVNKTHLTHHLKYKVNYGLFLTDKIMGTSTVRYH